MGPGFDRGLRTHVNRLQSLTPPFSDDSTSCRADRRSDPTPNDTLVKAAIDGRLPRGFGVKRLMDLPMAWPDQWSAFGLRAPAER
jgi:hypothetical protein